MGGFLYKKVFLNYLKFHSCIHLHMYVLESSLNIDNNDIPNIVLVTTYFLFRNATRKSNVYFSISNTFIQVKIKNPVKILSTYLGRYVKYKFYVFFL